MSSASSTFVAGQSPTAVQVNGWSQGTLGYAQVTANQTGITTVVDLTSLSVTVPVVAGRRIKITAEVGWFSTAADDVVRLFILQDGVSIQQRTWPQRPAGWGITATASAVITPAAGSHTYKLQMARDTGTGTLTMQATSVTPAFILVEDIGAV